MFVNFKNIIDAFHPRLPYLFITNERASILSSFRFDSKNGDLRPIDTVPTVPADFKERNALADIRIHPNGKFVYGSNRGHDSLAIVRIEEARSDPGLLIGSS